MAPVSTKVDTALCILVAVKFAPFNVRTFVFPEIAPLNVMAPGPPIVAAVANVRLPIYVAGVVELLLISAPVPPMPEPLIVKPLVLVITVPFRSSAAPLVIDTPLVLAPRAVALPTFSVPAEIVVLPV